MDPKFQALFFGLALICFIICTFYNTSIMEGTVRHRIIWSSPNLIALGLFFVDLVWFYTAFKVS